MTPPLCPACRGTGRDAVFLRLQAEGHIARSVRPVPPCMWCRGSGRWRWRERVREWVAQHLFEWRNRHWLRDVMDETEEAA